MPCAILSVRLKCHLGAGQTDWSGLSVRTATRFLMGSKLLCALVLPHHGVWGADPGRWRGREGPVLPRLHSPGTTRTWASGHVSALWPPANLALQTLAPDGGGGRLWSVERDVSRWGPGPHLGREAVSVGSIRGPGCGGCSIAPTTLLKGLRRQTGLLSALDLLSSGPRPPAGSTALPRT